MSESLFTHTAANVLVLGVGSLGGRVAKAGAENAAEQPCAAWAAAHTNAVELIATGLEHKLHLKLPDSPCSRQTVAAVLHEHDEHLAALVAGRSTVILAAALGESTAAVLLAALAPGLRRKGLLVCVVAGEPFSFEHGACGPQADAAREALAANTDLFVTLPAQLMAQGLSDDCALSRFNAAAEQAILAATVALAGALNHGRPEHHFTAAGLRPFLGGVRLAAGLGLACGNEAPLRATEAALATLLKNAEGLDPETARYAVALAAARDLSLAEAEAVAHKLQTALPSGAAAAAPRPPALLAFSTQSHLGDEAICLLLARPSTPANVVSIAGNGRV
jgi:cell division GTPase FtsZ